jgi:alpha-L-fucosidase
MFVVRFVLFLIVIFSVIKGSILAQSSKKIIKQPHFQIVDSGNVFQSAPFKACHASTIVETGKDTLLYAWFGGDHEGAKNVEIWGCYRYLNQIGQFGNVFQLAKGKDDSGQQPCWNPVLFKAKDGTLFLDYKVGPNPREWWAERRISTNNGKTWSDAKRLPAPFLGPIKNKPIQLSDETILYPSSTESKESNRWEIHLERTDGKGDGWQYIRINCDSFEVIQPSILSYGNDTLQLLCRSKQNVIVQTWSFDKGVTWTSLTALDLPNPNSGIDAVSLSNGWKLLVYNPASAGSDWWTGRSVLKVALSKNGSGWKDVLTLEQHASGEYSYPAIIQDSRGVIHIAYTGDRKTIKYTDLKIR